MLSQSMWLSAENMRQFLQSSLLLVCHLNILLCITWKVRVIEWTFAVHWAEMCQSLYSNRENIKIYHLISAAHCTHNLLGWTHTGDLSLWVDTTTSLSTLPCIMPACAGKATATTGLLQSKPTARSPCQSLSSLCVLTCLALRPESQHQQARTPTATDIDLHPGSGESFHSDEQNRVSDRFLSRSELKMFGSSCLYVANRKLTYQARGSVNSFSHWHVCKPEQLIEIG